MIVVLYIFCLKIFLFNFNSSHKLSSAGAAKRKLEIEL